MLPVPRRMMIATKLLHDVGFERLRLVAGLSPSGLAWRYALVPASHTLRKHGGKMSKRWPGVSFPRGSMVRDRMSDAMGLTRDAPPVEIAEMVRTHFPALMRATRGRDVPYVRWLRHVLAQTAPGGYIYMFADDYVPALYVRAVGVQGAVELPMPPPGGADV